MSRAKVDPATGVADFDAFRHRVGKVHRSFSGKPITAKRNRQEVSIACGGVLRKAFGVSALDVPTDQLCGRCWRLLDQRARTTEGAGEART